MKKKATSFLKILLENIYFDNLIPTQCFPRFAQYVWYWWPLLFLLLNYTCHITSWVRLIVACYLDTECKYSQGWDLTCELLSYHICMTFFSAGLSMTTSQCLGLRLTLILCSAALVSQDVVPELKSAVLIAVMQSLPIPQLKESAFLLVKYGNFWISWIIIQSLSATIHHVLCSLLCDKYATL